MDYTLFVNVKQQQLVDVGSPAKCRITLLVYIFLFLQSLTAETVILPYHASESSIGIIAPDAFIMLVVLFDEIRRPWQSTKKDIYTSGSLSP